MKAIRFARFGGPEVLEYVDAPDPRPGAGEVLIEVRAASVIPGDWKLRAGRLRDLYPVALPTIPGRDGAGVVAALGPGVDYARPGDEVCFVAQHVEQGSYAERIVRDAGSIVPKPPNLSFVEAAALMHAGVCAWIALVETAAVGAGTKLLVHGGAGAIGGIAVQLARHLGARVAATCRAADRAHLRALGADPVVAYDREAFDETLEGYDAVLDPVGGEVHRRSYRVLRPGGVLVWLIAAPIEDLSERYGVRTLRAVIHDRREILERVVRLAAAGAIRPRVARVLPLAQAARAQRLLEAGRHGRGRIVLEIDR